MQAIIKHDVLPFAAATIFKPDCLILHLQSGGSHASAPGLVFCFHSLVPTSLFQFTTWSLKNYSTSFWNPYWPSYLFIFKCLTETERLWAEAWHLWGRQKMLLDENLDKANWDTQEPRSCVSLVLGKGEPLQELLWRAQRRQCLPLTKIHIQSLNRYLVNNY